MTAPAPLLNAIACTLLSLLIAMAPTTQAETPQILAEKKHDVSLFTQGLFLEGETFYFSGGLYNQSRLVVKKGIKKQIKSLPRNWFAEGITVSEQKLYLLTWKANTLAIYDAASLEPIKTLSYEGEGWGLTHNDQHLIMSNGSDQLYFRNKKTFAIEQSIRIPGLDHLNELEYIDGLIWANRWYDDFIYAIDSQQACVVHKIDLSDLRAQAVAEIDGRNVTNGIAYDAEREGLWVTGKFWAKMFLIAYPKKISQECLPGY